MTEYKRVSDGAEFLDYGKVNSSEPDLVYIGPKKVSDAIRIKLDVEVSEAITGLKALQREAKAATKALAELREEQSKHEDTPSSAYEEYIENVKRLAGDWYSEEYRMTNDIIFGAYSSGAEGDIYVGRAMGTSTSIRALEATFKDVAYLTRENRRNAPDLNGKVVFVDQGVSIPRGQRIKRLLKISCVDGNGVPC